MNDIDFQGFLPELVEIRHQLHQMPEIGLSEFKTSDFIARQLEKWGFEITRGLARTGIVATLRAGNGNRAIGFRADFTPGKRLVIGRIFNDWDRIKTELAGWEKA